MTKKVQEKVDVKTIPIQNKPSKRKLSKKVPMKNLTLLEMIQQRVYDGDFTRNFASYLDKHLLKTENYHTISWGILLLAKANRIMALKALLAKFPEASIKMVDEHEKSALDYLAELRKSGVQNNTDVGKAYQELDRRFAPKKPFTIFDIISSSDPKAALALELYLKAFPKAYEQVNEKGIDPLMFALKLERMNMATMIQSAKNPKPKEALTLQPLTTVYNSINENPCPQPLSAQDDPENIGRFINIGM